MDNNDIINKRLAYLNTTSIPINTKRNSHKGNVELQNLNEEISNDEIFVSNTKDLLDNDGINKNKSNNIYKTYTNIVEEQYKEPTNQKESLVNKIKEYFRGLPRYYYDPFYDESMECRYGFYSLCCITILIVVLILFLCIDKK